MVKEQYELYLRNIYRKKDGSPLSESSLKHYCGEAVRKLNEFIRDKSRGLYDSIYDISSLDELIRYRDLIFKDPDFELLNVTGNNMYSAGFNRYLEFAEGYSFENIEDKIQTLDMPLPVKEKIVMREQRIVERNRILAIQSELACAFKCQVNPQHETFLTESFVPYVECHHIIPLSMQKEFPNSLDCYANLLVLCPTCHRFFHYGRKKERSHLLDGIYEERKYRLAKSGLDITLGDFKSLIVQEQRFIS